MDRSRSLEVRVEKRANKHIWRLRREGVAQLVKFSVRIYSSEDAARASRNGARKDYLARLAKKDIGN
jgi:hypothetical protein